MTPYIIEPTRAAASRQAARVVEVFGAQMGKTEGILDVVGHRLDERPAPCLYVGPNKDFLKEQIEPRFMALLDGCKSLSLKVARGKSSTKTRKMVAGVPLRLAHAGSSAALKSDPAALAIVDEYDEMGGNVRGQGGVLGLVELRGGTYADFVCIVTSTPSKGRVEAVRDQRSGLFFWDVAAPDELESPTWSLFQQGSRHHWCWPCPHCSDYFVPRRNLLRYPKSGTPMERSQYVTVECPSCGIDIEHSYKTTMNERGRYVAPGQTIDKEGNVSGAFTQRKALSYWASGLASPFVTWTDRVAAYLDATEMQDDAEIQTAVNGGFGECYSPGLGDTAEWSELKEKSKNSRYQRGSVPDGVEFLCLTVDVQKRSLPWVLRGWGGRATSWLVDYGHIRGETAEQEVWDRLSEMCDDHHDGLPIKLAFVDSGFRPGKPDTLPLNRIYEFCRQKGKRVRPTKGSSNPMRTPLLISRLELNRKGKSSRYGLDYIRLDTDHWKQWVHERITWDEMRPGAWMLPRGVDDDYCRQVVGEVRVKAANGPPEWKERGRHHDFLDCEAMQAAAGYLLNVHRMPAPVSQQAAPGLPKTDDATMHDDGRKPEATKEAGSETDARPDAPLSEDEDSKAKQHVRKAPRAVIRRGRRVIRSPYLPR